MGGKFNFSTLGGPKVNMWSSSEHAQKWKQLFGAKSTQQAGDVVERMEDQKKMKDCEHCCATEELPNHQPGGKKLAGLSKSSDIYTQPQVPAKRRLSSSSLSQWKVLNSSKVFWHYYRKN